MRVDAFFRGSLFDSTPLNRAVCGHGLSLHPLLGGDRACQLWGTDATEGRAALEGSDRL
jgi:hypothetical protein